MEWRRLAQADGQREQQLDQPADGDPLEREDAQRGSGGERREAGGEGKEGGRQRSQGSQGRRDARSGGGQGRGKRSEGATRGTGGGPPALAPQEAQRTGR